MEFMDILALTVINILMDRNDHKTVVSLSIALGKAHFNDFKKRFWYSLKPGDFVRAQPLNDAKRLRRELTVPQIISYCLAPTDDPNVFRIKDYKYDYKSEWYRVEKITKCLIYMQVLVQQAFYHKNENVIVCNAITDDCDKHITCKKSKLKTGWTFMKSTMKVPRWIDDKRPYRQFDIMKDETKAVIPVCEEC